MLIRSGFTTRLEKQMADEVEIPNIGALLGPLLSKLDSSLLPTLLAGLERGAAGRYRSWAANCDDPDETRGLLACAGREDEIADRVERLFPLDDAARADADAEKPLPEARRLYLTVFDPHPQRAQYRIQASAEREGAAAWRGIGAAHPSAATREELEAIAGLEEENAAFLESLFV